MLSYLCVLVLLLEHLLRVTCIHVSVWYAELFEDRDPVSARHPSGYYLGSHFYRDCPMCHPGFVIFLLFSLSGFSHVPPNTMFWVKLEKNDSITLLKKGRTNRKNKRYHPKQPPTFQTPGTCFPSRKEGRLIKALVPSCGYLLDHNRILPLIYSQWMAIKFQPFKNEDPSSAISFIILVTALLICNPHTIHFKVYSLMFFSISSYTTTITILEHFHTKKQACAL